MGAPTPRKRTAKKAAAPRPPKPPAGGPRRATESEVSAAEALQQRINTMTALDEQSAINELTAELGNITQQMVVQRAIVRRLVNHILTIDPDDRIAQKAIADLERASGRSAAKED